LFFLKSRFITFAFVGGIGTAAHFTALSFFIEIVHIGPVFSSSIGYIIGFLVNYLLNYTVTFSSEANHISTISKYFIVTLLGFLMNLGIITIFCQVFRFHYLWGQLISTGTIFLFNYFASCHWVFLEKHR